MIDQLFLPLGRKWSLGTFLTNEKGVDQSLSPFDPDLNLPPNLVNNSHPQNQGFADR